MPINIIRWYFQSNFDFRIALEDCENIRCAIRTEKFKFIYINIIGQPSSALTVIDSSSSFNCAIHLYGLVAFIIVNYLIFWILK